MNSHEPSAYSRRDFIRSGLIMASAAVAIPQFIQRSALALPQQTRELSSLAGVPQERILVVIQLSGGNDGLNTVVPFTTDAYYKARPAIAIPKDRVLKLGNEDVGLHPAMTGMKELHDDGLLGVIQGVGYPNPNRSHFKSMDIWHTADTSGTGDGWLGRYYDSECCGFGKGESGQLEEKAKAAVAAMQPAISIGRDAPLALKGRSMQPVAFESADLFQWTGTKEKASLADTYRALTQAQPSGEGHDDAMLSEDNSGYLTRTALDAQVSSDLIRRAVAAKPRTNYPNSRLADELKMVASMIHAKLATRVYYVTLGGFDTHDNQGGPNGRQANLLTQLSAALRAFYTDLKLQGNDGRVMSMVFTEFGRRVQQNGSNGTDHGTAGPVFIAGPMVKAGVLSEHPSMTDLDQGDLKYKVDFRSVYAAILSGWMKADAKTILDGQYPVAPILKV
jgi:uncharacterized protein (DUF1501 family)